MTNDDNDLGPQGWEVTFRPIEGGEVELLLPKALAETARLRLGQEVHICVRDGKIIIEPRPPLARRIWTYVTGIAWALKRRR